MSPHKDVIYRGFNKAYISVCTNSAIVHSICEFYMGRSLLWSWPSQLGPSVDALYAEHPTREPPRSTRQYM